MTFEAHDEMVARGRHLLSRGGRAVLPVGAHFVPVEGPDWPWRVGAEGFEPAFQAMARSGLNAVRIDLLWSAIEPEPGRYDEDHLRILDALVASARGHGLWLHPALFIGGEVGDAFWDVPWRDGRHPHRDPEMLRLQAEHAAALARRWRADPTLIAWDLTDEPPYWLFDAPSDSEARVWTSTLVDAIRAEDPDHLITIGTAGQEVGWGPFRSDNVADLLDFVCVHPYPIYQPELYPDSLLSPRMTHAGALETALAAGAGRAAMVHEYGASSTQFDPEAIAAYDRLLCWSSLGRGAIGFFAWCWTDAEPSAYARAPYVRQPHETQFGVTDWRGGSRPRGIVLSELAALTRNIDLDAHAAHGSSPPNAAIVVPHEYVRPYDPGSYGLSEAPSGLYRPSESMWSPRRGGFTDVAPLVRAWLNSFVMASRADMPVAFVRESLAASWPEHVRVLLLPAPLASTTTAAWHVRTSYWSGALSFLRRGGVLYVSCSADVAIPEMDGLAGCSIAERAPVDAASVLRFVSPWGPFRQGDELALPRSDGALATRGVRLRVSDAETVAVDAHGAPALVVARRGSGRAVTCAFPIELLAGATPDAHGSSDRTWGIYAGVTELGAAHGGAGAAHPDVTTGELSGESGGLAIFTNHSAEELEVTVRLPEGATAPRLVTATNRSPVEQEGGGAAVALGSYGAAVVEYGLED